MRTTCLGFIGGVAALVLVLYGAMGGIWAQNMLLSDTSSSVISSFEGAHGTAHDSANCGQMGSDDVCPCCCGIGALARLAADFSPAIRPQRASPKDFWPDPLIAADPPPPRDSVLI